MCFQVIRSRCHRFSFSIRSVDLTTTVAVVVIFVNFINGFIPEGDVKDDDKDDGDDAQDNTDN